MKRLLLLLVSACGPAPSEQVYVPAESVSDSCLQAWHSAADAWDAELGLQERCAHLDESVTVRVLAPAALPCPGAAGCAIGDTIYISSELSDRQAPLVAVHEWLHLIRRCETGDGDAEHIDPDLWAALDKEGVRGDTIEAVAIRATAHGPCLGD